MPNPVVHFGINTGNAKDLEKFYSSVFDWHIEHMDEPMGYGMVDTHAGGIGGGIGQSEQGNQVTIYIEVDDPQAFLNKIEAQGGKTIVPVTVVPNMVTFAQFADPQGNIVGLVKAEQH